MKYEFSFADLFSGIGGFHAALAPMGGKCAYAVERDKSAATVYQLNWGIDAFGDAEDATNAEPVPIPAHDILTAGFPCQPFSKSGDQLGMQDARGTLFWSIARTIEARRPAMVILENVRNLVGPRHRHEWNVIINTLRNLGYRVSREPTIFSPHWLPPRMGGTAQIRERVFIHATRVDDHQQGLDAQPVTNPVPYPGWDPTNWDVVKHTPLDGCCKRESCQLSEKEVLWIDAWDDFVTTYKHLNPGQKLPGFPIWVHAWKHPPQHPSQGDGPIPKWKYVFLEKNQEFYENNKAWLDVWLAKWSVLGDDFPPSRRKFEWQAGNTKSLWDAVMHFRPSGIRAKGPTYLPALVAMNQTSIIGPLRRRISAREAARLQGFDDSFSFGSQPEALSMKQLGNAVHVGVVQYLTYLHAMRDADILQHSAPQTLQAIFQFGKLRYPDTRNMAYNQQIRYEMKK